MASLLTSFARAQSSLAFGSLGSGGDVRPAIATLAIATPGNTAIVTLGGIFVPEGGFLSVHYVSFSRIISIISEIFTNANNNEYPVYARIA